MLKLCYVFMKYFLALATLLGRVYLAFKTLLTILSTPEIAEQGYLITPSWHWAAIVWVVCDYHTDPGVGKEDWHHRDHMDCGSNPQPGAEYHICSQNRYCWQRPTPFAYSSFILSAYYSLKHLVLPADVSFILKCLRCSGDQVWLSLLRAQMSGWPCGHHFASGHFCAGLWAYLFVLQGFKRRRSCFSEVCFGSDSEYLL